MRESRNVLLSEADNEFECGKRQSKTSGVLVHKEIVFSHLSNKDKFLRFPARPPMSGAGGSAAWSNFFCRSSSRCAILPSNNRFFHLRIKLGFIP